MKRVDLLWVPNMVTYLDTCTNAGHLSRHTDAVHLVNRQRFMIHSPALSWKMKEDHVTWACLKIGGPTSWWLSLGFASLNKLR